MTPNGGDWGDHDSGAARDRDLKRLRKRVDELEERLERIIEVLGGLDDEP